MRFKARKPFKNESFNLVSGGYTFHEIGGEEKLFEGKQEVRFINIGEGKYYVEFLDYFIKIEVDLESFKNHIVYNFVPGGDIKDGLSVILEFLPDSEDVFCLEVRFLEHSYFFYPEHS